MANDADILAEFNNFHAASKPTALVSTGGGIDFNAELAEFNKFHGINTAAQAPQDASSMLLGQLGTYLDSASLGGFSGATSLANAGIDKLTTGGDFVDLYTNRLNEQRGLQDTFSEQNKAASLALKLGGGFVNPVNKLNVLKIAPQTGTIARLAKTAVNQGVQGGIIGGATDGTEGAVAGTILGSVGGTALEGLGQLGGLIAKTQPVMKLAQNSSDYLSNLIGGLKTSTGAISKELPVVAKAVTKTQTLAPEEMMLLKSLDGVDESTINKGLQELADAKKLNSPLLLQEALDTPELYQQAKSLGNTTSGRQIIQTALNKRADTTPDRLNAIYDAINPERNVLTATMDAKEEAAKILLAQEKARSAVTNPLFEKAFANKPLDSERMLELFQNPKIKRAAKQADEVLSLEHPNLAPTDSRRIQEILYNLGGKAGEATRKGNKKLAQDFLKVKSAVEKEVDLLNPDLLVARKAYADISKAGFDGIDRQQLSIIKDLGDEKIADAGKKIFQLQPEQISKLKDTFSENPDVFDGLVRSHLQNLLETTKDNQNALKNVMSSIGGRKQLEAALGDKFPQFEKMINFEQKIKAGERAVKNVSATQSLIDSSEKNQEALNFISQVFSGGMNLTKNIAARIMNNISNPSEEVLKATAKLYADPDAGYNALKNVMSKRGQIQKYQKKVGDLTDLFSKGKNSSINTGLNLTGQEINLKNKPVPTRTLSVNNEKIVIPEVTLPKDDKLSALIGVGGAGLLGMNQESTNDSGVPDKLLDAVRQVESGGGKYLVSNKGALGAYQIMPDVGKTLIKRRFGVDLKGKDLEAALMDEAISRLLAGDLMKENLDRFGDANMAIAAYNAGAPAVAKYGGTPPYKETKDYVKKVNLAFNRLLTENA